MAMQSNLKGRPTYIIDGSRTPFLRAGSEPGLFSAADLALSTTKILIARQPFAANELDEVITGCVMPSPDEANIGRIIALRLGCGNNVPGWTVQRNCASGMQALDNAAQNIALGRSELVLAGGTEAMSRTPLLYNNAMVSWLAQWRKTKSMAARARLLTKLRPTHLSPVIALLQGLRDPIIGLSMGQTAENLAYRFAISRQQMDKFALRSHTRLKEGLDKGYLSEITPIYDGVGNYYERDTGLRRDTTLEKLKSLKPVFDKKFGCVTAGNSSQVTDGAAYLLLASEAAVKTYQLPVLAKIVDVQWSALDPKIMGLGPVHATASLLSRQKLSLNDIDYWEINEAFAAQVLACMKAWEETDYCQNTVNLAQALGQLNEDKLNVDGGAIALGHPIGASGARIVLHLVHVLQRLKAKRGIATICIGGGQGGAMLIENI